MTTSTVLRTLQRQGLIKRKADLTDTRAKSVVLTAKGLRIAALSLKIVEKFDRKFFSILGKKITEFNKVLILLRDP
jgi:DNA-binding MarR family transcriptional regulator